jgi:PAS domain S-box-containing protein
MARKVQTPRRGPDRAFIAPIAYFICVLVFQTVSWSAAANETQRRIFLLEGLTPTQPAGMRTLEAFKDRLKERGAQNIEIFVDFLELGRFPGPEHEAHMARFLSEKFAKKPPDLLVPISRGALAFLMQYQDTVAHNTSVIYCCTAASAASAMKLPREVVGVVTEYSWSKTLDLAERLQPDARNLVVIAGSSDYDREWLEDARREIEPRSQRYQTGYLTGLPYDELLREVSRLPRDSIVLLVPVFEDGSGQPRAPPDVAADLTKASSAPVYAPVASLFGQGIVGGFMDSFEAQGIAAADLALEVLSGKDRGVLPAQTKPPHAYRIDARQLARWRLSENDLPSGAVVLFKQPTLWEQHRYAVLASISAFALQTIVLAILLIQIRRRRQAEQQLKDSEARLAFAAASANIGIWRLDVATNDLWATDHCRTMLGLPAQSPLTSESLLDVVYSEDRQILADSFNSARQLGLPINREFRVNPPEHEIRWLVARGHSVLNDAGKPLRISGIFADITERKAAEAEADLQRKEVSHLMRVSTLGELSGAIAHELNQPLTAILAYAQAARRLLGGKNPQMGKIIGVLDDIVQEDNRASEVIRRLHGLLRKGDSKSEAISVNDLVYSTLRLLHSEVISRRIKIDTALEDNLPRTLGDPVQLQQVFLNLLMNAMDAMNATAPVQRLLTVETQSSGNGIIEMRICDRGHGIGEGERGQLFQPFFTTKDHGLGLGLSICSKIVKAHGGNLRIDNNSAGGATASLTLPVRSETVSVS